MEKTQVKHTLELGENAFWVTIWMMAAMAIVCLITTCLYFGNKQDKLIAASSDPIATACAFGSHSTLNNQCTALLARGK
jgi:hypothetical protein